MRLSVALVAGIGGSAMWRWIAYSSSAYEDRDGQIVSTKALADDCARADAEGNYGPLLWWHLPGAVFGDCDFNAMHGRMLIEMGTFRSDALAIAAQKAARNVEVSLGFNAFTPVRYTDGVYHTIRRFERSLVPRGRASNRFTQFLVVKVDRPQAVQKAAPPSLKDMISSALSYVAREGIH